VLAAKSDLKVFAGSRRPDAVEPQSTIRRL